MKKGKFLFVGLACLAILSACSNEELLPGNKDSEQQEGHAQMQIQLTIANSVSGVGTRADNVPTQLGDESEYTVKNITVVLADNNDIAKHVYKKIDVKGSVVNGVGNNTKQIASEVFNVEAGSYKVYVLANYDDGYMTPIITNSTDMKNTVFSIENKYVGSLCPLAKSSEFLMTDTEAPSSVTQIEANAGKQEVNSDGNKTEGGKDKVNVVNATLERSVAKVTFSQDNTNFDVKQNESEPKVATATLQGVDLINLNSKMYLNKKEVSYGEILTQFADLYYAKDPNYNTNATSEFFHSEADYTQFKDFSAAKFYCLENTMEASKQLNGLTTGVVYKVKYVPESGKYTKLAKNGPDPYSEKFTQVLNEREKPESITDGMFEETSKDGTFYVYSELIFATLKGANMYKAIAENENISGIIDAYGDGTASNGITTYTDGLCYYTAWIRHNTLSTAGNQEQGKYGVVRNHWYNITVNSIKKLGYHEPTYENPENPDDKSDVYMQILVTINPWRYINQSVDLE